MLFLSSNLQVWTVSMPVVILNSPHVSDKRIGGSNPAFGTALDIIGIILWAIGWAIESTADVQKVNEFELTCTHVTNLN